MGKKCKKICIAAPLCLFWTLWRARNRLVFENEVTSAQRIKANFVSSGLGLTCIVLIIQTLFWISSHGWGVGRVFEFVPRMVLFWLPFVHYLCTPGNFSYLYNICFLLIKKKKIFGHHYYYHGV